MLVLENVEKVYGGDNGAVRALDGVSLTAGAGDFVAVWGPSGCGKTTLLLTAGGLLKPTAGRIIVNGKDLYGVSSDVRASVRASTIGFVFQQFYLVPYLTVLDNVLAPSLATSSSANMRDRAIELIERFGLGHRRDSRPATLSTGERQRTALARALLNNPQIIMADEPTGNLDPTNGETVLRHLADFASGGGTVMLVTHDQQAANYATRMVNMDAGKLV
ncbi:MAG: ABC transporter ATP-binding protein [Candidatus Hydrogenedentes bacterium]|nr:ABC transporter ATP-binding protein [Candidatus Hydrogenedentota bacterium]